jgi:hypothetical protein
MTEKGYNLRLGKYDSETMAAELNWPAKNFAISPHSEYEAGDHGKARSPEPNDNSARLTVYA